jgi:hypothetical protein
MKKTLIGLLLILGLALGFSTPAFAGNGAVAPTEALCLSHINSAAEYEPTLVSSRERMARPMNGWRHAGLSGRVCVLERTAMAGHAVGEPEGWWWVVIDGGYLVSKDGAYADSRCFNVIRKVAQAPRETATVVAECTNCNQPITVTEITVTENPQPRPQPQYIPQVAPMQQAVMQPAPVPYQRRQFFSAPMQVAQGGGGSVAFGGSYNTSYQQQPAPTPIWDGRTNPPIMGQPDPGIGGVTNPPVPPLAIPTPGHNPGTVAPPVVLPMPGVIPGTGGPMAPWVPVPGPNQQQAVAGPQNQQQNGFFSSYVTNVAGPVVAPFQNQAQGYVINPQPQQVTVVAGPQNQQQQGGFFSSYGTGVAGPVGNPVPQQPGSNIFGGNTGR